jgi:hypothetical protein
LGREGDYKVIIGDWVEYAKLEAWLTWGGDWDAAEEGDSPGMSESTDAARSRRIGIGVGLDMLYNTVRSCGKWW